MRRRQTPYSDLQISATSTFQVGQVQNLSHKLKRSHVLANQRKKQNTEQTEITEQTEKIFGFPLIPLFPFVPSLLLINKSELFRLKNSPDHVGDALADGKTGGQSGRFDADQVNHLRPARIVFDHPVGNRVDVFRR